MFLEHKAPYNSKGPVPQEEYTIPFGEAAVRREGKDVTVVAVGLMVLRALEAAEILAKQGISEEVIDPRTVVPLDKKTILQSIAKTGRLAIADEAYSICGFRPKWQPWRRKRRSMSWTHRSGESAPCPRRTRSVHRWIATCSRPRNALSMKLRNL